MKLFVLAALLTIALVNADLGSEMGDMDDGYAVEGSAYVDDVLTGSGDMDDRSRRQAEFEEETTSAPTTEAEASTTTTAATTTATEAAKKCKAAAQCESHDDCNGGSCLGFLPGRCNCNACIGFFPCKDDTACGGLQGACNTTKKVCDCEAAYKAHGYATIVDRLTNLCNKKTCANDECNGLKCNKGFCACNAKPAKKD